VKKYEIADIIVKSLLKNFFHEDLYRILSLGINGLIELILEHVDTVFQYFKKKKVLDGKFI
jgi:hypothetical protein